MNRNQFKGINFPKKMCEIDPLTGKSVLIPLDFGNSQKAKRGNSEPEEGPVKCSNEPFEPLDFNKIKTEIMKDAEKQNKKRKLDAPNSAKRLFTSNSIQSSAVANNHRRKKMSMSRMSMKSIQSNASSPLMNMEEVEKEILTNKNSVNNIPFKPPQIPTIEISKPALKAGLKIPKTLDILENIAEDVNMPVDECVNGTTRIVNQPRTPDSSEEFLQYENMCRDSPISSMCNLMQHTGINSIKKPKPNFKSNSNALICIKSVEKMIQEEEIRHQQNMFQLNSLLASLKSLLHDNNHDKENHSTTGNRRSERLQKKSPLKSNKLLTSPAILRSDDLRKNTLKKNMVAKNPDCIESPRTVKAIQMYNSFRSVNTVLETPKSDRKNSNLSYRIQTQCLLLQDTPVHHK